MEGSIGIWTAAVLSSPPDLRYSTGDSRATEMRATIPIYNPSQEIEGLWDELNEAIRRVLRSGIFILGEEVEEFESEVGAYLGVKHCVGLNSGTDALVIGLRSLGVRAGDEVITTAFTFFATVEAILLIGAKPVLADIDPDTFNLNTDLLTEKVTARTKAILPVHMFGRAAEMDAVCELAAQYDLKVLEDVAQAFSGEYKGHKLGAVGDAGALSFFPSKNLGACGDGGLLATDDDDVAETARMLRAHGAKKKYHNEMVGYNSRLDALQAAVLRVKLRHIGELSRARNRAAQIYDELLEDVPKVVRPSRLQSCRHAFHQYTVRVPGKLRDLVRQRLAQEGIQTKIYYPIPVHHLPVFAGQRYSLPEAETASQEVISLPLWPDMDRAIQVRVCECMRRSLR